MPDGDMVRGAKRGGVTDHIAGPHLIPNVGREAMVPAECVRRQKPAPKKKPLEKPPPPPPVAKKAGRKAGKRPQERRAGSPEGNRRERSRGRQREGSGASDPASSDAEHAEGSPERPKAKTAEQLEEELRREAKRAAEATEREAQRLEEERRKLQELEEARTRKSEMAQQRRSKLSGLFALDEDDMEEEPGLEVKRAREAKEKQRMEDRRQKRDTLSTLPNAASVVRHSPASSSGGAGIPRLLSQDSVTALDIDGSGHDHKFSRVWQHWDASKKDDPGEIARMFMKVSQVKRRGYEKTGRRSRSRSRGR